MPVLWKNRLFLFWVRLIQQTPLSKPPAASGDLSDVDISATVNTNSRISVKVVLCWSEYYNGKWQAAKTSDPVRPAHLGTFDASGSGKFNRSKVRLWVPYVDDTLIITIGGQ